MLKPNIALTMFPLLIPKVSVSGTTLDTHQCDESCPFYIRRISVDGLSKKLIVQVCQAETGLETVLEIPPSQNQALVHQALELAMATNTPVLLCLEEENEILAA